MNKLNRNLLISLSVYLIFLAGCATISTYDQYAYIQTTSLKVDAISLMDLANENYQDHIKDVTLFKNNMQKIYEYEKNRPKNEITVQQWDILLDTTGKHHLLGEFINMWRDKKTLSKVFIADKQKQIGLAFDQISGLESKKIKASNTNN